MLQEQALDFLNTKYKKKKLEEIAQNHLNDEYREEYRLIETKLARCEHFAVGVEEKTYGFVTLYKLSGNICGTFIIPFLPLSRKSKKQKKQPIGTCQWWMRCPGNVQLRAAYVDWGGSVFSSGSLVDMDYLAVRPALWVNLGS